MKIRILTILVAVVQISAGEWSAYLGPHFNYTRILPDERSHIQGYEGGVTAGISYRQNQLQIRMDYEKTSNAGPVIGKYHPRCVLCEHNVALRIFRIFDSISWKILPYMGIGWDQLNYIKNCKVGGVQSTYDTLFVPIGIAFTWRSSFVDLSLQMEYRSDVYNHLKLVFVDLTPKPGYGYRIELPITQKYDSVTLSFVPFFDANQFGQVTDVDLEIPSWILWKLGLHVLVGYKY